MQGGTRRAELVGWSIKGVRSEKMGIVRGEWTGLWSVGIGYPLVERESGALWSWTAGAFAPETFFCFMKFLWQVCTVLAVMADHLGLL